jgi:hypothetical protein
MFPPSHVVFDLCSVKHISEVLAYGCHRVVGIDTAQHAEPYTFPRLQNIE